MTSLNLSHNYLKTLDNISILKNCISLSVLDLSNNRLEDILIVKLLSEMAELRVLILTGNPVVSQIPAYRKTLIIECVSLNSI